MAARVRNDFEWRGMASRPDGWFLLFQPDRFIGWRDDLFRVVPQGGGDVSITHRCPGESITVRLLKSLLAFLAGKLAYPGGR